MKTKLTSLFILMMAVSLPLTVEAVPTCYYENTRLGKTGSWDWYPCVDWEVTPCDFDYTDIEKEDIFIRICDPGKELEYVGHFDGGYWIRTHVMFNDDKIGGVDEPVGVGFFVDSNDNRGSTEWYEEW